MIQYFCIEYFLLGYDSNRHHPADTSLSPTSQRTGISNHAYDDDDGLSRPPQRRASSESKEKIPLLPDPIGVRRRNDSELSWSEQVCFR